MSAVSMRGRLLFVINDAAFFASHRLVLAQAARVAGYDVHIACAPGPGVPLLTGAGFTHHPIPLSRSGLSPWRELRALVSIYRLMRWLRPAVVHLVTPKAVIYGGIAARYARVRGVVAAISGLGHVFTAEGDRMPLVRALTSRAYRFALGGRGTVVITQNPDDAAALLAMRAARQDNLVFIRGSGVDLAVYAFTPEAPGIPVVVFAARLLRTKGVGDFVAAARRVRASGVAARFVVAGDPDPGNHATVTAEDIVNWRRDGVVEFAGHQADIARLFAAAHVVVLPSVYGEGLPKVLIEAAACGRAVITTDMPGCRDAIESGVTGILVPPHDVTALAAAIESLLQDPARRRALGSAGRALAERAFAIGSVVARHLELYERAREAA